MLKKIYFNENAIEDLKKLNSKIQNFAFVLNKPKQDFFWFNQQTGEIFLEDKTPFVENMYKNYSKNFKFNMR